MPNLCNLGKLGDLLARNYMCLLGYIHNPKSCGSGDACRIHVMSTCLGTWLIFPRTKYCFGIRDHILETCFPNLELAELLDLVGAQVDFQSTVDLGQRVLRILLPATQHVDNLIIINLVDCENGPSCCTAYGSVPVFWKS